MKISRGIVSAIREQDPPGHFLERDPVTGLWNEIGDKRAIEKTSQALREGQPNLRKKIIHHGRQSSTDSSCSWGRRASIDCVSWNRRGSMESVSSAATSFSEMSRRSTICSNLTHTFTHDIPIPNVDVHSHSLGFGAFECSSSTSGMILKKNMELLKNIQINHHDGFTNDTAISISNSILPAHSQPIDATDKEITDIICETFALHNNEDFHNNADEATQNTFQNLDNDDFDHAQSKISQTTLFHTNSHINGTESTKSHVPHLQPGNSHQSQSIFNSIALEHAKKGVEKEFPRFFGNRAA